MEEIKFGKFTQEVFDKMSENEEIIEEPNSLINNANEKGATFEEKEALIELANGIAATIARVSKTFESFENNSDINKSIDLEREISRLNYSEINVDEIKKKIDALEKPYTMIEDALSDLAKKGIAFSFDTNTKEFPNGTEYKPIKEAIFELNKREIYIVCNNNSALEFYKDLAETEKNNNVKVKM